MSAISTLNTAFGKETCVTILFNFSKSNITKRCRHLYKRHQRANIHNYCVPLVCTTRRPWTESVGLQIINSPSVDDDVDQVLVVGPAL